MELKSLAKIGDYINGLEFFHYCGGYDRAQEDRFREHSNVDVVDDDPCDSDNNSIFLDR